MNNDRGDLVPILLVDQSSPTTANSMQNAKALFNVLAIWVEHKKARSEYRKTRDMNILHRRHRRVFVQSSEGVHQNKLACLNFGRLDESAPVCRT